MLYTLRQGAEKAGVNYEALSRLVRLGRFIPDMQIGHRYFLTEAEIEVLGDMVRQLQVGRPRKERA